MPNWLEQRLEAIQRKAAQQETERKAREQEAAQARASVVWELQATEARVIADIEAEEIMDRYLKKGADGTGYLRRAFRLSQTINYCPWIYA